MTVTDYVFRSLDLAKTLSERLDEMGKDLTSMIEEINDASSTLSKNNKPDDPVSLLDSVARITLIRKPAVI